MDYLERFVAAMDGEWEVVATEFDREAGGLRVTYLSLSDPDITWSHVPHGLCHVAPVGTVGHIGFVFDRASNR